MTLDRRTFLETVGATGGAVAVGGCLGGGSENENLNLEDVSSEVISVPANLRVTNHDILEREGEVVIQGTVKNTGEIPFLYAEVVAQVYDSQDQLLDILPGESNAKELGRLEPNATHRFRIRYRTEDFQSVARYTLKVVNSSAPSNPGDDSDVFAENESGGSATNASNASNATATTSNTTE